MDHSALLAKVNSALDAKVLTTLSEREKIVSGLSTGSMKLNHALSGNPFVGFVWGRIVEIYGPEMSGKTTLTFHLIHEAQRLEDATGKPVPCMFVDAEHAFDPSYAEAVGVDLSRLAFSQPDSGEQALDAAEEGVKLGYKLIIVDSVSALTPRAEIEGEMGASHVGLQARLMSQACRKLNGIASKKGATIIFINQIRFKIGVMFGNPETTSGGNALKFYASYRLDVRSPRSGKKTGKTLEGYGEAEEETVETGINTKVKVVKNKLFPPHRSAILQVDYGKGINKIADVTDFLEYAGAFKNVKGSAVLMIRSKAKAYTKAGLKKIMNDPAVQTDVINIIKKLEAKA